MINELVFKVFDGYPGGFAAEFDGYLCLIEPSVSGKSIEYEWSIQEGGGKRHSGDDEVRKIAVGLALSSSDAEKAILGYFSENNT